jgi:hypothetical protein
MPTLPASTAPGSAGLVGGRAGTQARGGTRTGAYRPQLTHSSLISVGRQSDRGARREAKDDASRADVRYAAVC